MSRRLLPLLPLILVFMWTISAHADPPSEVDGIAAPILKDRTSCALVIGIVDRGEARIFGYGQVSAENPQKPDGDTLFEIGSLTKTFTSVLLSDAVLKNEVHLDDPIRNYLPDSAAVPARAGGEITLRDLARHTSGLPRLATNMAFADPRDPYSDYTVERLYEYLRGAKWDGLPGTKMEYSNLGAGLLGHLLARKAGCSYEQLLQARICRPLRMTSTTTALPEDWKPRLAQGYDENGLPGKSWFFTDAVAGAGAIRSTGSDMVKYLSAHLGRIETGLRPALEFSHQAHLPENQIVDKQVLLGWFVAPLAPSGVPVIHHSGQTGCYHSFLGFVQEKQVGVVVLMNHPTTQVDEVGLHLLRMLVERQQEEPRRSVAP